MSEKQLPKLILGLRPTLICSIGALTILSVGLVALMSYLTSRSIVSSLGSGLINQGLARLEQAVRREFDALTFQADYVERLITQGAYSLDDPESFADFLQGTLAAAPQINGAIVANTQFKAVAAIREERGDAAAIRAFTIRPDSGLRALGARAAASEKSFWREPRYLKSRQSTVIGLCTPFRDEKGYHGFMVAGIFARTLSEFTRDISRPGRFEAFILFGPDHILAHPSLVNGSPKMSAEQPLLAIQQIDDPVLAELSNARAQKGAKFKLSDGSEALVIDVDGVDHHLFMKRVDGYGDLPLYVGAHFRETRLDRVLKTLHRQGMTGLGLLLIAMVLAIVLSRMIARPIRRASRAVSEIRALDFDKVEPLERSRLREIDDLAVSFNAMLGGLQSFGRYVPRSLVTRLIRENRVGAGSEERELTVMFTDIASFSKTCESMTAKEVADFINDHLSLVSSCIEAEGGTIDKYIGDAVMAFWGAPDTVENTADPACRAALAIRAAVHKDNERRKSQGNDPVRMRIGIHSGALVVGDIGTPTRINYTVVGDVVNGAQRLEALGKEVAPDEEVSILISRETQSRLTQDFASEPEGARRVKGKEKELEVFRLV